MAMFNFYNDITVIGDPIIRSLDYNNSYLTVPHPQCNIASVKSNSGVINVTGFSSITMIEGNQGIINVMKGSSIGSVHYNCGKIDVLEGSDIGPITNNCGRIDLKQRNNLSSIDRNSGVIVIGESSAISAISHNCGKITLMDNCTIDVVSDNIGKIKLGDQCVVKSVIGSGDNIQCGVGCYVPVVLPRSDNVQSFPFSFANGSFAAFNGAFQVNFYGLNSNNTGGQVSLPQMFQNGTFDVQAAQNQHQFQSQQLQPLAAQQNQPVRRQDAVNEELLCGICMDNKKDTVFNCGHTCCGNCAGALRICHICRTQIVQKLKLFI